MHTNLILLNIILGSLFSILILFLQKKLAQILIMSTLLVKELFGFNEHFIIWNYSMDLMPTRLFFPILCRILLLKSTK